MADLAIEVIYASGPGAVHVWQGLLPAGARVQDALDASGMLHATGNPLPEPPSVGIWGRKAGLADVLQDRDRVELYRPLTVDPKVARRERFRKQGRRGTGLFAGKRPGAA